MRPFVAIALAVAGCGPRLAADAPSNAAPPGGEVTLYRDRALVLQRVDFDVPPAGYATVRVKIAAGIGADDLYIVERDRFTIREIRVPGEPGSPAKDVSWVEIHDDDDLDELEAPEEVDEPEPPPAAPKVIELVLGAPRAGRHTLHVGYLTDRLAWEAAYTLTTTPVRDRAVVRGALAIRNALGIALPRSAVRVVDAELGDSIRHAADLQKTSYVGGESTTPEVTPRELGRFDLADGETRVELLAHARPRPMRSVLVYDPVGTSLDNTGAAPVREETLGARVTSTRVTESFEIARDVAATKGLPAGAARLLERRPDGTIALLGETRLFDAASRVANVDLIAIGTADGVVGHRERRDYTYDEHRKRLVEEFVITIDNRRTAAVEVLVRDHLYRGTLWTLPYPMPPAAIKEGPQQFAMRTIVPAKQQTKLLYVVVYWW